MKTHVHSRSFEWTRAAHAPNAAPRRRARPNSAVLCIEAWHLRLGSFAFTHDL